MTDAYNQVTSLEDYQRHHAHFRHVAKDLALDRVFAEHHVNVIIAPADSMFTCLAAGSGMSLGLTIDARSLTNTRLPRGFFAAFLSPIQWTTIWGGSYRQSRPGTPTH